MSTGTTTALLPVATGRQVRRYVQTLLRGRWKWLAATIVVMIGDSALGLAGPIAIGQITQAIAEHKSPHALLGPIVLLAAATVAAAVTGWASTVLLVHVVLPGVARLREATLTTAVRLPVDVVEAGGIGDLVSRVSGDVERVSDAAEGALGRFLAAGLAILSTLVGLASLDWRLALAGLLVVPVQAHALRWYLRTSRPIYAGGRIADGKRASAMLAGFTALPTLRVLRLGQRQRDRIAAASTESMQYEFRAIRTATRFYGRLNVAEFIGLGAILLVAFVLVRDGTASIGAATTAALFFAALFNPINTVLGVFDSIQQATASLARLVGITTTDAEARHRTGASVAADARPEPAPAGSSPASTAPARRPALDVDSVRFGYPGRPDVLHDITLHLPPGRHVAIVGATGSGKSTLASLLAGLRQPHGGRVTLDGTPAGDLDPNRLHRTIALVTQETHVFAGTIADNLRLARPQATTDNLTAALDAVGAGWITTLPDGLDTAVGSGGAALTASQAQQLALARLLLLDPAIVVLDEATAEGGSDTARALDHAATVVTRDRSAVVIAHSLSQTATADTILVMDAGRIVEHGTHDDLLNAGGSYAALWAAWSQPRSRARR
ncbi:ABC transporter ATP-binding protein [Dactylosporangium sp. NPDC051484]|uniref:ABC transporter ATP-binding protein n=1 Tax=Dactylosporangium sp. NPDC051484 TaxID=3154942 RepID=UPI00344E2628